MIGIKIADGTFFPILQESEKKKKKVILTTVKDEQPAVQIDLYRGEGDEMKDASYVGSLMINNITPAPSGDPEIELLMGIDEKGNLASTARDIKSREEQSLSIELASLPPEETYDMPEFEVTESEDKTSSAKKEKDDSYETPYFSYNGPTSSAEETEKSRKPLLVIVGIGILAVLALVITLVFFTGKKSADESASKPELREQAKTPEAVSVQQAKPPAQAETKTPIPSTPAATAAQQKGEQILAKPESIGVWYSTVKGDNLWNLSHSFYRNPWLYKKIAEQNGISNPNLIQQNFRLYIPDVETGRR